MLSIIFQTHAADVLVQWIYRALDALMHYVSLAAADSVQQICHA